MNLDLLNMKKLENIVKNAYKKFLNREPDTVGLEHYISLLEQEKINEFQFHELIKSSQEFMILHPEIIPKIIFPEILESIPDPEIVAMYRIKNEERWIEKSLKMCSEVCQKIVILDDGSTDETLKICKKFPSVVDIHEQKNLLFEKAGVDFIIVSRFNKSFSKISADNFIKKIIVKKINPNFIFVSNNFKYGFRRSGNVAKLISKENIYNYKIIKPSPLKKGKKIISSTLIRKLLQRGELKNANKLLGRNWSIIGVVQKGRRIGKKLGVPTCNIDIKNYVIAKPGVYSVRVKVNNSNKIFKGIANLGYRPTFGEKKILLEVNLFDFSGNLYNKSLNVSFYSFIRSEKKFNDHQDLIKQIEKDLKQAKFDLKKNNE